MISSDDNDRETTPPDGLPLSSPDVVEAEHGALFDNMVPSFGYALTPMVGLGGSAGSIAALQSFFETMNSESGMVFVVILHLSPLHTSTLPDMIQGWTRMRTLHAEDGQRALPNHVYVIPPGKHLTVHDGHLRLTELHREHGRRVAVDLFFRSLADTHGPHAAAVILSGANGDGVIGIKRIKERGGLTIAQDPEEAENASMPDSAIATGMVDWVLPAAEIPSRLVEYVAREQALQLPPEDGPPLQLSAIHISGEAETAFREILVSLRARTGRDFSYYKRATVLRRISRRMQVNGVLDMPGYLAFLGMHQGELGALLKDLLISVTNFFRDREVFDALNVLVPLLFKNKGQTDSVRVWCPACATGEEAYSIAMLLLEHARALDYPPTIQIFGCDLNDDALRIARAGVYPDAIAADVSEERLRRFFVKEHGSYRIRREVRESVLFAQHDLIKDAPFSRIDLVSCRNLLIYLDRKAQARALAIINFSLRPDGLLVLGSSESVEEGGAQFTVLNKKRRIYQRKTDWRSSEARMPPVQSRLFAQHLDHPHSRNAERLGNARSPAAIASTSLNETTNSVIEGTRKIGGREADLSSWSDVHFKLLERLGPPSVIIDQEYDIKHISASARRYLQVNSGVPTTSLLHMIMPELRVELRALLFRASQSGVAAASSVLGITLGGHASFVSIRVSPALELAQDMMLVLFESHTAVDAAAAEQGERVQADTAVHELERELEHMKNHLRDTAEQHEAAIEELKASNEELQAMNEELRSATEELETSREELQSINEELTTVNQESKNKVEELGQANSDLQNLMGATAIATIFLNRDLRIMRFTHSAAPLFNLISSDVGRPLSHMRHEILYPALADDAERVLQNLAPVEREVQGAVDSCYLVRMLPYRTVDDRIAGVVITFVDITERQRVASALLAQNEQLEQFSQATVDREVRMVELKREINGLLLAAGRSPRYQFDDDGLRSGMA